MRVVHDCGLFTDALFLDTCSVSASPQGGQVSLGLSGYPWERGLP